MTRQATSPMAHAARTTPRRPLLALALCVALAVPLAAPVGAQTAADPSGLGAFVTPFPDNDTYRIQVYGDSFAEGLVGGLVEALGEEARIQVQRKHRRLANLFRSDAADESLPIDTELSRAAPHIAVIMSDPAERVPWRQPLGRRFQPGSEAWKDEIDRRREAWKAEHTPRLDRLMRAFRKHKVAVYWVSLPILRRQDATDDAQFVNELVRERAYVNGVKFIDVLAAFADDNNSYSAHGPDLTGKPRLLRESDGIHFTAAGYRKLAHFVERDLRRDIVRARSERNIPLAGSETEQRRVRPAAKAQTPGGARTAGPGDTPAGRRDRPGTSARPAGTPEPAGGGDIRADNVRVTLTLPGQQGRDEQVTLDILRPSIPANVVQLVTRRQSRDKASQVGDSVPTQLADGSILLSSVTAVAEILGDQRRVGPANSPYYRALVKGEKLPPAPGRADDLPWPRAEVPAVPAAAPEQPARPAPTLRPPQTRRPPRN